MLLRLIALLFLTSCTFQGPAFELHSPFAEEGMTTKQKEQVQQALSQVFQRLDKLEKSNVESE